MKKWITGFLICSALIAPAALASARTDCLNAAKAQFKTDSGTCKDLQNKERRDCQRDAGKKFKEARKACPGKAK